MSTAKYDPQAGSWTEERTPTRPATSRVGLS